MDRKDETASVEGVTTAHARGAAQPKRSMLHRRHTRINADEKTPRTQTPGERSRSAAEDKKDKRAPRREDEEKPRTESIADVAIAEVKLFTA